MPLFYQQDINDSTRLAIWHIQEEESFFGEKALLQRPIGHPHKRLQHLAGRYLLKTLFPEFPNEEMLVAETNKPYLPNEQFHFSISHCGDFAAAIVSRDKRVGIDIELYTPRVQRIRHKFLHPDELRFVDAHTGDSTQLLTLLWSAKEAMYKWWGFGEVDFSEVLRLQPFPLKEEGHFSAHFEKESLHVLLLMQYRLFPGLALCYVASEADQFKMTD